MVVLSLSLFAGDGYVLSVKAGKITPKTIEKVYEKHGFKPSENRDMNEPYQIQFKQTDFDIYNLFTYYNPEIAKKLLVKNPMAGIYVPQSMSIWKKKGENEIHAAFLKASGMAHTLGMDLNDPDLIALEKANLEVLKEAMPGAKIEETKYSIDPKTAGGPLITKFEKTFDSDDLEDFQMFFEDSLKPKGFVIAGYNDYGIQEFDKAKIDKFVFYSAYSICKLKVIYNVAKKNPEAGMFAPCTLVNYMLKGTDKLVVAYPSIYNWISGLHLTDENAIKELKTAQKDMEGILKSSLE